MTSSSVFPNPLTPANCDLQDFAYMPLDVLRLRDSELASNETPEACWAALLLWAASWHQVPAASIPNDDKWIAKAAGYALRGKIDKAWKAVRSGALRGWVECSDGRLYHTVVAEKALDAWQAKLRQRWGTECARIKKHNDRHGTSIVRPSLEEWLSLSCPQGQPLFVPKDSTPVSPECPDDSHSKGEREGKGKGEDKEKTSPGRPDAREVLDYLNAKAKTGFRYVDANLDLIQARLKQSTVDQCKAVIDAKCAEWMGSDQAMYLRPETLFGASKFEQYIGQLGAPGAAGSASMNPAFRGCK